MRRTSLPCGKSTLSLLPSSATSAATDGRVQRYLQEVRLRTTIRSRGGRWLSPDLHRIPQIGAEARVMEQRHDLAIGAHYVRPRFIGAIFLPADGALTQLGPQRGGVDARDNGPAYTAWCRTADAPELVSS